MANSSTAFLYWYRRYRVRAKDMTDFQTAMVETARSISEAAFGASILQGFQATPGSGLQINVAQGLAAGPSGYLGVMDDSSVITCPSVTGSLPVRHLIVVSPVLTDADNISSPTSPFNQVPLHQLQQAQVRLISGTPSQNPEYPPKGSNDAIICGVYLRPAVIQIDSSMLDFEKREVLGVNSQIAKHQIKFDDRLRPFRSDYKTMGIKPSQTVGSEPLSFSYTNKGSPSLYPLDGGLFVQTDSFVDFSAGTVTGGDQTTPDFTPVIPTVNQSIVCAVTITRDDVLRFRYGIQGSYAQCVNSIRQQNFSAAGSIPEPNGETTIAYVVISSLGGVFSDIQVFDGRALIGQGAGPAKYRQEIPSGNIDGSNNGFVLSQNPADGDSLIVYIDAVPLQQTQYTLSGANITITDSGAIPQPGQSIYCYYLVFGAVPVAGATSTHPSQFTQEYPAGARNGVNATFTLSATPTDQNSLILWLDSNPLDKSQYTLVGNMITITDSAAIPQLGQTVYAYYMYLGAISSGPSSGGYAVYGSESNPLLLSGVTGLITNGDQREMRFLASTGGEVDMTGLSPQIFGVTGVGKELLLIGTSDTDYPKFGEGNGLSVNGVLRLKRREMAHFIWIGTVWCESGRKF